MFRFFLFLFVLFNMGIAHSQQYEPMLGETNEWYLMRTFEGSEVAKFSTLGDTVLFGKTYKPFGLRPPDDIWLFIREDTSARKVYALPQNPKDSNEYLIYFI